MDLFRIEGGTPLHGELRINGSKNAALPQMAAALLADDPITLQGVPDLADIRNLARLLRALGCDVEHDAGGNMRFTPVDHSAVYAPYDIVKTMRASICVLGPLLAKRGSARVSMPGGCAIGERPVDLHRHGLEALGASIELNGGDMVAHAPEGGRLRGATVFLGGTFGSTVLGTANVMSAATLADGTTVIESAACEPEIVDLARLLRSMGAKITGDGSPRITIEGVESLSGATHAVMPDRIEAATFMCAAGMTDGELVLNNCPLDAMLAVTDCLKGIGVSIEVIDSADPLRASCRVRRSGPLQPARITTNPHPGFPTDVQAQMMALLCLADGHSVVTERIFPERFLHVAELSRMGAVLHRQSATVVVTGTPVLRGAPVMASDLRASASLVLAGLAARGETVVHRVYHLDRGYKDMDKRLETLGAKIRRENEGET